MLLRVEKSSWKRNGLRRTKSDFRLATIATTCLVVTVTIFCCPSVSLKSTTFCSNNFLLCTFPISNWISLQYGDFDPLDAIGMSLKPNNVALAWTIPTVVSFSTLKTTHHRPREIQMRLFHPLLMKGSVAYDDRYSPITSNMRNQLKWISQSVKKQLIYENDAVPETCSVDAYNNFCENLVDGLISLSSARNEAQVIEAGRKIEYLMQDRSLLDWTSMKIQEHIVKAASASSGLLLENIALPIMRHMTCDQKYLPSNLCQDALFSSLRKAGNINDMELILKELGTLYQNEKISNASGSYPPKRVSNSAFNIYLASLCDMVTNDNKKRSQTYRGKKYNYLSDNEKSDFLHQGWSLIKVDRFTVNLTSSETYSSCQARDMLGINPDAISYATLMQGAAVAGNETLVDLLWNELTSRKMQPNIFAYNARMRVISNNKKRINSQENQDTRMMEIWNEIQKDKLVRPDRYSVDLILLPTVRTKRFFSDIELLLDDFIQRNSETVVSDAFAAFLGTLVNGNELTTATRLFEKYVSPTLSPVMFGNVGSMRMIRPISKHFNILLEGYRKHSQNITDQLTISDEQNNSLESLSITAWNMFHLMQESRIARPDAYTITTMMGLCTNSTQLSNLIYDASTDFGIDLRDVVLRAALTAYGDLSDPDSALWIFYHFSSKSTRSWNTLLGALVKSAKTYRTTRLEPPSSCAARIFDQRTSLKSSQNQISLILQNSTITEAIQIIFRCMSNADAPDIDAPPANSQTYCVGASALQYSASNASSVLGLFREANEKGFASDGRFLNAVIRGYGDNTAAALQDWKKEIRQACVTENNRTFSSKNQIRRNKAENLFASYNGLLHVCGRSFKPEIALRVVYAMKKEGLEANEVSLNSYKSGKRIRGHNDVGPASDILQKLKLANVYESLLEVECLKYDQYDRRRKGEQRVRIIV